MTTTTRSPSDIIEITAENISDVIKDVPKHMAYALRGLTFLQKGSVEITVPGSKTYRFKAAEPGPHGEATLHNWGLAKRVMTAGSLGLSESYVAGEWDSPDVTSFLELFLVNSRGDGVAQLFDRGRILRWVGSIHHWFNRNTKRGSKRNIAAHYDLGNAFYEQWLDPSMTYSSAWYGDGANSLEEAQEAKYRALSRLTDIRPEHHVLEIGCGWGGFAEHPGGMLPSDEIMERMGPEQGLNLIDNLSFGYDYASTLQQWRERFWSAWPTIEPLGFDARFKRMWEFYLHYCEAGFKTDGIDVRQMIYQRG